LYTDSQIAPQNSPKGISRRTIVKGAAWSVPVIAAAVAVPAHAASVAATCLDIGYVSLTYKNTPIDAPLSTQPSPYDSSYDLYALSEGQSYLIASEMTVHYSSLASDPVQASTLALRIVGTNWFNWELVGTPTVESSAGPLVATIGAENTGNPNRADYQLSLSEGIIQPGGYLTLKWTYRALSPVEPAGTTGSGYAYTAAYVTGCNGAISAAPDSSVRSYNLYQYVQ